MKQFLTFWITFNSSAFIILSIALQELSHKLFFTIWLAIVSAVWYATIISLSRFTP